MPAKFDANKVRPVKQPAKSRSSLREWAARARPVRQETVTVTYMDESREFGVRCADSATKWALEQQGFDPATLDAKGLPVMLTSTFVPLLLMGTVYDLESGDLVWTEDGDEKMIGAMPSEITSPLFKAALRVTYPEEGAAGNSEGQAAGGSEPVSTSAND